MQLQQTHAWLYNALVCGVKNDKTRKRYHGSIPHILRVLHANGIRTETQDALRCHLLDRSLYSVIKRENRQLIAHRATIKRLVSTLAAPRQVGAAIIQAYLNAAMTTKGAKRRYRVPLTCEQKIVCDTLLSGRHATAVDPKCIRAVVSTFPVHHAHIDIDAELRLNHKRVQAWIHHGLSGWCDNDRQRAAIVEAAGYMANVPIVIREPESSSLGDDWDSRYRHHPVDIPTHTALFFRLGFTRSSEDDITNRFSVYLDDNGITGQHRRQMWDTVCSVYRHARGTFRSTPSHDECARMITRPFVTHIIRGTLVKAMGTQAAFGPDGSPPTTVVRYIVAVNHARNAGILPAFTGPPLSRKSTMYALLNRTELSACIDKNRSHTRRTYTDEEIARLYGACESERDRVILLILSRTGLRNAALRTLLIRNCTSSEGMALEKGRRIHRFFIDDDIRTAIDSYLRTEHPEYTATEGDGGTYLFPDTGTLRGFMTARQLNTWIHNLADRAGVRGEHTTIHSFRRYVVTKLMESKNTITDVARYVGHTNPITTERYWITNPESLVAGMTLPWADACV